MSHNITVESGSSVRLPTAGKYCDRDIVVTASGGGGDTSVEDSLVERTIIEYRNDRVTTVGLYAFTNITSLTSVDFPLVTTIKSNAFQYCSKLVSVNFPLVTSIGSSAFGYCAKITRMDFPLVTEINTSAFNRCTELRVLILRSSSMATLKATSAFSNTPIASGKGYVYVPSALIDTYKTATNWSTYADKFRALEDYTVDGTITGELDETKI